MKKILFKSLSALLLAGCMLTSCEKVSLEEEGIGQTSQEEKNVIIRISDMDAGWGNDATRSLVNVSEVCSRVNFAIYQNGQRVKYKNQAAGDDDFGTYALTLDEGSYQLLVLAHSGRSNPATTNPAKIQFTNPGTSNGTGYTDTFYYYGNLVVGNNTQVDISMRRATSMFRFITTDVKPDKVKKLQFYYTGGSGALDATTGFGCVDSKQSVFVETGSELTGKTLQYDMYTFLHAETGNVSFIVKAFDQNEDILYSHEFTDVRMQRNCITQYSGKFFVNDTPKDPEPEPESLTPKENEPSSIIVMVDPEWGNVFKYNY